MLPPSRITRPDGLRELDNKWRPIQEAADPEADESQHSSNPSVKYPIANRPKYRAIRRAGHKLDPMGVLRFASSEASRGCGRSVAATAEAKSPGFVHARARARGRHRRASRTCIQRLRVSRPNSQETRLSPKVRICSPSTVRRLTGHRGCPRLPRLRESSRCLPAARSAATGKHTSLSVPWPSSHRAPTPALLLQRRVAVACAATVGARVRR